MSIREAHDGEADAVVDMFIWKFGSPRYRELELPCPLCSSAKRADSVVLCVAEFSTRNLHPRSAHLCTYEVDANSHTCKHDIGIILYVYKQISILALKGDG
jgi:hypothetical protein